MGEARRRLAAIMFADMVGYTALMQEDEDRARIQRDRFVSALRKIVEAHHGNVLQHYGDGALSVFDSAVEAVEAAVALQEGLSGPPPLKARVGVHAGDIVEGDDGIYGDGVNVASRIESLASPGGVMVSGKVYDEIKNHPYLAAEPRGEARLKNVKRPIRVFAITSRGLSVPSAEEVRAGAWRPEGTEPAPGQKTPRQTGPEARAKKGDLIRRIGRRSLVQWGFAYLAGAWAFLEAADFAQGAFLWSVGVSRALVIAVIAGLPVTLVVAWYHGKRGRQTVTGPELALIGLILAAGVVTIAVVAPNPVVSGSGPTHLGQASGVVELPSIAVLPFVNVSGTPEAEPFAVGIHDDVLTQLSKIRGLRVISRTSVLGYRDTQLSIPEIARELGVGAVLEGGVQRVSDRIRMNAQLIDAGTDAHLWAERFDAVYTVENIFAIQSAIATSIADALEAVLTPVELAGLGTTPTDDPDAYELYLSGIEHLSRPGWVAGDLAVAQRDFEAALAEDPEFALAWANLSVVHFLHYRVSYDTSPERLELIRATAERALTVDPDLPDGHLALSHYFNLTRQMDQALAELATAGRGLPNDPWVPVGVALVRQRQGAWDEAVGHLQRAVLLDPRNPEFSFLLADTYVKMRRWDEAMRQFDRTLAIAPGMMQATLSKSLILLARDGEVEPMLSLIDRIPPEMDLGGAPAFFRWWGRFLMRDFQGSEEPLVSLGPTPTGWPMPYSPDLLRAFSRWFAGEVESARQLVEAELPTLEADARVRSNEPGPHEALGLAYAMLGRSAEAVREGRRATELLPISSDAYDGPLVLTDLARIYALVGDVGAAIDQLEILMSIPADVSSPLLAIDPSWDPLRGSARFQALLDG